MRAKMLGAVVLKSNGTLANFDAGTPVVLGEPSVVRLEIGPELVREFLRDGNDLRLVLADGRVLKIEGFFIEHDGQRSELVFEDANGVVWWGQYTSPWSGFHIAEINETVLLPFPISGATAALLGGALAAVAIGSSGSDGKPDPAPAVNPPQVVVSPPANAVDPSAPGNTTLTGTVTDPNATVTVTVGGTDYSATVNPDGTWTVVVPNTSFDGSPITATATNSAGSDTDNTPVPVVPALDVTIDDVTTPVDPATPGNTTLTGTVTDPTGTGTVTVTVGGTDYQATINPDGTWTVDVPNASFDGNPVEATVTRAGETASDETTVPVVPAAPALDVTIDDVTTPVDPATPGNTTLTGTVTDPTGTGTVTVTVGGSDY
ncbi:BapA prefix-like domain-containing protein, partial [Xinfangfangia sp. D13-10-4-6]|uniref:BapA/Bap/LapF family prefix-like domain-containing protein n=1 Tax=Pseudogemmobacter hezensis TaxID=2737662 RepID=UPI0015564279